MTEEPMVEFLDGQFASKEYIWDQFTELLLERKDGADELLEIMTKLGMSDIEEQKRFVAMCTELRVLSTISSVFVNFAQLFVLAKKWGVSMERMSQLKLLVASDFQLVL